MNIMNKYIKVILLIFLFTTMILGSSLIISAQESITIKFSMSNPLEPILSHESALATVFKQVMETNTNGRINVELYPSNVLGSGDEQWNMVKRGTIEMAISGTGILAQFYPLASVLNLPYLFSSHTVASKVMQGDFGKEFSHDVFEKTGVRIIAYPFEGFYLTTNSVRPIHTPEDLKGLRIRSMSVPIHLRTFEALGAKSTTVAWEELYGALQTGVVDGEHNALTGIIAGKLYEVQKYLTFTNHFYGILLWIVNDEWLNSLSDSDKNIFWDAVGIAMTASIGATRIVEATEEGLPFLKKQGMEMYAPTPEEMEKFRALAIPEGEKFIQEELGEEGMEWLNKLKDAVNIAEEEVKHGDFW